MKYCHLDSEELNTHWETGKTVTSLGDFTPIGADVVRRRRLAVSPTPAISTVDESSSPSDVDDSGINESKSKGSAQEAAHALAAFTGHGQPAKL